MTAESWEEKQMNSVYSNIELTKLYEQTYSNVYAVVYSIVKKEQDVCDLVQDTYLSAFSGIEKLSDISKFDKWVIQIAANKCKDFLRKKKPTLFSQIETEDTFFEDEIPDSSDTYNPDAAIDSKEVKEIVKEIIYSLPEDQRLCIVLYYGEELKISEISEALGISENTVKSRLNYAKKKIKQEVEALEKKGTKLYGISGLAILPLIRQLFGMGIFAAPPDFEDSAASAVEDILRKARTAKSSGDAKAIKAVYKIITKNLATKIVSAVVATTIVLTGVTAIIKPDLFTKTTADKIAPTQNKHDYNGIYKSEDNHSGIYINEDDHNGTYNSEDARTDTHISEGANTGANNSEGDNTGVNNSEGANTGTNNSEDNYTVIYTCVHKHYHRHTEFHEMKPAPETAQENAPKTVQEIDSEGTQENEPMDECTSDECVVKKYYLQAFPVAPNFHELEELADGSGKKVCWCGYTVNANGSVITYGNPIVSECIHSVSIKPVTAERHSVSMKCENGMECQTGPFFQDHTFVDDVCTICKYKKGSPLKDEEVFSSGTDNETIVTEVVE